MTQPLFDLDDPEGRAGREAAQNAAWASYTQDIRAQLADMVEVHGSVWDRAGYAFALLDHASRAGWGVVNDDRFYAREHLDALRDVIAGVQAWLDEEDAYGALDEADALAPDDD